MVEKALAGRVDGGAKNSLQDSAVDGGKFYRSLARSLQIRDETNGLAGRKFTLAVSAYD